jgi:putative membrane protein insertion efficiency factor
MKLAVLWLLRGYKRWISPLFPPACRYVPTCSEYAKEAVDRYGVVRGGTKAAWRLLRCHPLAKAGLDPVVRHSTSDTGRNDGRNNNSDTLHEWSAGCHPAAANSEQRIVSY